MPCHNPSNTLRLFIRNVTNLKIHGVTKTPSARHFQRSFFRKPAQLPSRAYSSAFASTRSETTEPQTSRADQDSNTESPGHDVNAFAEFSLDAIDALAAESKSNTTPYQQDEGSPAAFLSRAMTPGPPKKRRERVDRPGRERSKPVFTKTVTENTGFKIHNSSPRLPRIEQPTPNRIVHSTEPGEWKPRRTEPWQMEKDARKEKYPEGWNPRKRLSPDAIAGIRALHAQEPEKYHVRALASHFEISSEAISRILSSKWVPSSDEETDRMRRWFKRGENVWSRYAELGVKPPKKWRDAGIGKGKGKKKDDWKKTTVISVNVPPALVTLPRREGGLYTLREKESDNIEDKIF